VFAVTRDPFIVFTSNIFAILGLRAMYFLLAGVIDRFRHLKTGLAVVRFSGVKMLLSAVFKLPIALSLGIIALILAVSVAASLISPPGKKKASPPSASDENDASSAA
jgi:tellurite resistance protein TerC